MSAGPGHTVLQVPVPPLEEVVRGRHAFYDPAWVSADPSFVHAHVTALGPWLSAPSPEDLAVVAEVAAATEPFDYVLARVATFPTGIIHLVPEPDGPFRELTARLAAAFPQCPPYAGELEPVPHLTLDLRSGEVSQESTRRLLGDAVPARCRADALDLAWYEAGGCRLVHRWPLGGAVGAVRGTCLAGAVTTPEEQRVLRAFLDAEGRLHTIPSKRAKLLVVLDHLAQAFEPGRTYTEAEVNQALNRFHPDHAALRRYLVEDGFLTREDAVYRRSDGTSAA